MSAWEFEDGPEVMERLLVSDHRVLFDPPWLGAFPSLIAETGIRPYGLDHAEKLEDRIYETSDDRSGGAGGASSEREG